MSIPALDERGLLPAGIHQGSWAEIERVFATSAHRAKLLHSAKAFICRPGEFWQAADGLDLWIGGSFVTDKPTPSDIECTVALTKVSVPLRGQLLALALCRREDIKRDYGVDLVPTLEIAGHNDLRDFFQYVGPKTAAEKGLKVKDKRGIVQVNQWMNG